MDENLTMDDLKEELEASGSAGGNCRRNRGSHLGYSEGISG